MAVGYKDLMNAKDNGSSRSARDVFRQYFAYLPLFILSLVLCIGAAYLYIKYTMPKYRATTLILVKDNKNKSNSSNSATDDILENAMNGMGSINLENELQRLRSSGLMQRVVQKNGFNVSYYIIGQIRTSDVYLSAPFRLVPVKISDSSEIRFTVSKLTQWGATLSYNSGKNERRIAIPWNREFVAERNRFFLKPSQAGFDNKAVYEADWKPVNEAGWNILSNLSVGTSGTKTTIIELSLLTENLQRGKDILNALAQEFKQSNIEELNKIALNTISFIDDRLDMVSDELKGVEGNLESFKGSNQAFDLSQQSSMSFSNSDATSKSLSDISVQQKVVDMVKQSLLSQGNETRLIPSTLGIEDQTLDNLVLKYNELELKKESNNYAEQSLFLKDINSQLHDLRISILDNLETISNNLKLRQNAMLRQGSQYNSTMSALPRKERVLQEIKRQQGIKEGLFLYLLQKREEAAISRTSKPSAYEQIDPASGYGPVEPNKKTTYKIALLIAIVLPLAFIYLRNLFNDKVRTREDIMKRTTIPIAGEISHIRKLKSKILPALKQDLTGEQFRLLRSNISFLQKQNEKQVILITSTTSGDGKSFISLNLAAVFAKAGKKVALLEFDLRKPHDHNLTVDQTTGITDYLNGKISLGEACKEMKEVSGLHVYPAGPFVSDPADLLLDEKVSYLFQQLKLKYDIVVVNSAPAGLVSDAQVLGHYADLVLYVIRQEHTGKKHLGFIDDLFRTQKMNNMCLVFNDVRTGVKYGYDGYGYSKGNSYYKGPLNGQKRTVWSKMKDTVGIN